MKQWDVPSVGERVMKVLEEAYLAEKTLRRRTKKETPSAYRERQRHRNGLCHAIYTNAGDIYVGEWKNSLKEGKGRINNENGWLYEGDWLTGKRHGHGALTKRHKSHCHKIHYIGDWCQGKRDGQGRQIYEDGNVYIGEWSQGKRCGHGRIWYKNGDFYEGDWYDDKPHGYGIFVYANGCRYEGEWMNGLKHGHGHFYHLLTGQLQDGLWIEGVSKCSDFTVIPYRQTTPRPTQYPLPKLELKNNEDVHHTAEEYAIDNYVNTCYVTVSLEDKK